MDHRTEHKGPDVATSTRWNSVSPHLHPPSPWMISKSALPKRLKTVLYVGLADSWTDTVEYLCCHTTDVKVCQSTLDWLGITVTQLQTKKASQPPLASRPASR
ncbi:hypothetical protein PLESTM_002079800 [Pleodorina starrii]|nr:hypothetical protein PLESTM_000882100 [Pleodorina starrii]GLC47478.1 hypothetical protein PLESTM_002079800 [Pleodorina starrii]